MLMFNGKYVVNKFYPTRELREKLSLEIKYTIVIAISNDYEVTQNYVVKYRMGTNIGKTLLYEIYLCVSQSVS